MRTAVLCLTVLLTGCANRYYEQPGKTAADFEREYYDCQKDAAATNSSPGRRGEMTDRCLKLKGYTRASSGFAVRPMP